MFLQRQEDIDGGSVSERSSWHHASALVQSHCSAVHHVPCPAIRKGHMCARCAVAHCALTMPSPHQRSKRTLLRICGPKPRRDRSDGRRSVIPLILSENGVRFLQEGKSCDQDNNVRMRAQAGIACGMVLEKAHKMEQAIPSLFKHQPRPC